MRYLRQNTATRVTVGPFIAVANGTTPLTAITATSEHLNLVVDDAGVPTLVLDATATASAGNNDLVFITGSNAGYCDLELTAAQTNYVGRACLSINFVTDHLPVFHEFMIVPANVYDSLFGTDLLDVSVVQNAGTAITSAAGIQEVKVASIAANAITATSINADAITDAKVASDVTIASVTGAVGSVTAVSSGAITEASFATTAGSFAPMGIVDQGTAQSATGTTLVLRSAAAFADDELIGATIVITGGSAGVGQARVITDYVSTTDTATVDTWTVTPTGTITYKVFAGTPAPTAPPAVNVTQVIGDPIVASSAKTTNWGGTV